MMRRTWLLFLALLFPAGCQQALQMSDPVAAQSADASACQALRALNLDNLPDGTSSRVSSASLMTVGPEGLADPGVPLNWAIDKDQVQQYCEVVGYAARQNQVGRPR